MQLKVLENKKLFLSYAMMNVAGYDIDNDMPMHDIRIKVRKDLEYLKDTKEIKMIKKILDNHQTYASWLNYISIHSTTDFAKILPEQRVKKYDYYKFGLKVKDQIVNLNKKYNLNIYYEIEIANLYYEIIAKLKFELSELPLDNVIADFWQYKFSDKGIMYINPLDACYQAGGGKKGNTLITIPGPSEYDKETNKVYYKGISVLGNLFHEFSHSYARRVGNLVYNQMSLNEYDNLERIYFKIINSLDDSTQELMKHSYNNWRTYFEECFVKVADKSFITPIAFKSIWTKEQINWYIKNATQREVKNGFVIIPLIIEEINKVQKMKGKIEDAWLNSINRIIQDWK